MQKPLAFAALVAFANSGCAPTAPSSAPVPPVPSVVVAITAAPTASANAPEPPQTPAEARCERLGDIVCLDLGVKYEAGRGVDKDEEHAVRLYRKACEHATPARCLDMGWQRTRLVAQTLYPMAAAGLEKECGASVFASCRLLGSMHEEGRGMPKDPVEAAALYDKGCTGGELASCTALGKIADAHALKGRYGHSEPILAKACGLGDAEACSLHAELPDLPREQPFMDLSNACRLGQVEACGRLDHDRTIEIPK